MVLAARGGQLLLPRAFRHCFFLLLPLHFVALAFISFYSFFSPIMNQAVALEAISAVSDCTTVIRGRLGSARLARSVFNVTGHLGYEMGEH